MRASLVTPARSGSHEGNRVTAVRYARQLRDLGPSSGYPHRVQGSTRRSLDRSSRQKKRPLGGPIPKASPGKAHCRGGNGNRPIPGSRPRLAGRENAEAGHPDRRTPTFGHREAPSLCQVPSTSHHSVGSPSRLPSISPDPCFPDPTARPYSTHQGSVANRSGRAPAPRGNHGFKSSTPAAPWMTGERFEHGRKQKAIRGIAG